MNFEVDKQVWETIMMKMYLDWSAEKMHNGEKCRLLDSYIHTAANVAYSLVSCDVIREDQYAEVEARLRNRLFQPDGHDDSKTLWLYHGGNKEKYLTFGCVHCQRTTSLYYSANDFEKVVKWFFWA